LARTLAKYQLPLADAGFINSIDYPGGIFDCAIRNEITSLNKSDIFCQQNCFNLTPLGISKFIFAD
jgi:hypothetical protein